MDDIEKNLYLLMEVAEQQQKAVSTALAGLDKRQIELAKTAVQLQGIGEQLVPKAAQAASEGAARGVKTELESASQTASDAVAVACQPLLAGLAGVAGETATAEGQLKEAVKWFGWRWAALAAATACGAILAVTLAAWGAVWWQRSQLADLKIERDQVNGEVTAAQSTLAALNKRTGGVRYVNASDGKFINVPGGFKAMTCVGNVPCIRLK
ncbi:hypothetical protein PO883_33155 [Massilia sp. DJPM01]|uniref:hypothetical protein n=1 Tax=Massilia sp. DJPM01 TaxID=3024404 RepID=UPI00259D419E|nr:hypothetical protein [Massilia sp. DJPM01]MDM5182024.1 hypothetical protein [Massilia sp. DJPM01]